jgi:uncharacterized peroxidase-related enzyme
MSRINIPTAEQISSASQPLLAEVKKQLGVVPNLMKLLSQSPAALDGYLSLNAALRRGTLDAATAERIALAVAELNSCDYCLSGHTYLGTHVAKLTEAEIVQNRRGSSSDPKAAAAVQFATAVVKARGQVDDADLQAVQVAGYNAAEILEIVLHVALNTLTNYVNVVAQTDIDFPRVSAPPRAAA